MDTADLGLFAEVTCSRCNLIGRVHVQLGGFLLEDVLGIGGMSVVYRALDISLRRPLALKVLNDNFRNDPERIERFENESAMMARVRHENITAVYSAGRAYDQFFIAMELVEGENLEYHVNKHGPLQPLEAVCIVIQVARGLAAAQKAGLLHRDMKPGNILLTRQGKAKIIDFGLALAEKQEDTEEVIWATPYYAAPETLNREQEDARADIYALGITLSFLLTGVGQFAEPIESVNQLLNLKRNRPPFAEQKPGTPAVLSALVDHMTAFSPGKRSANYHELIEELEDVRRELDKQRREDHVGSKLHWKRPARNVMLGAVSLLLGGVLALILSPAKFDVFRDPVPAPMKKADLRNAETQALQEAIVLLNNGKTEEAEQMLLRVARESNEPAIGAWCARLALFLCTRSNKPNVNGSREAHSLLKKHLLNIEHALPAGRAVLKLLAEEIFTEDPPLADWFAHKGEWEGLSPQEVADEIARLGKLKCPAALGFLLRDTIARHALWAIGPNAAAKIRSSMRQMSPRLKEYAAIGTWVNTAEEDEKLLHLSHLQGMLVEAQPTNCPPREGAEEWLLQIEKDTQAPPILRTMAKVKREAVVLSRHLYRTFARKKPKSCRKGMPLDAMLKALEEDPSGIPAQIIQDARAIFGVATDVHGRRERVTNYLKEEHKYSPEIAFILHDWEKRLAVADDVDKIHQQKLDLKNTQQIEDLLQACRDTRLVTVLPGTLPLNYINHPESARPGTSTILPRTYAELYARLGKVRIEATNLLPMLGLRKENFENYSLSTGIVQPMPQNIAEHFEQSGAGVILRNADDLRKHSDSLADNPRSSILLRIPFLR